MNIAFALEYSLGHATHADQLKSVLRQQSRISPTYIDLPYHGMTGAWTRLPGVRSNWSLRASLGAYLALRRLCSQGRATGRPPEGNGPGVAAALFHTQVTSLFSAGLMTTGLPGVISLDATPEQYDALGSHYGHRRSAGAVEALKKRLNRQAFLAARRLVTWSEWTRQSLIRDYGIPGDRIEVIPPGVDTAIPCHRSRRIAPADRTLQILFIGGDFVRKGGDTLLAACRDHLPARPRVHLHLVTRSEGVPEGEGITVYRNLTAGSPEMHSLLGLADIFVFPTRADCLPLAVLEALAAWLPVITTDVGALSEAVQEGENGLIVPPDDPAALAAAIVTLGDASLRARLARRAREVALERFSAETNYRRLLEVVRAAGQG